MPKLTFKTILIVLVIMLIALPFVTTFNEFLTSIVMKIGLYRKIQDVIVPWEIGLIRVVISLFGIESAGSKAFFTVIRDGRPENIWISWNCIGWQTFLLFIISAVTGLQGPYKTGSKIECITIGILGTFLVNIFRISLVVILLYFFGKIPAMVLHDYFSTFIAIGWLIFFWKFSFSYILEPKNEIQNKD